MDGGVGGWGQRHVRRIALLASKLVAIPVSLFAALLHEHCSNTQIQPLRVCMGACACSVSEVAFIGSSLLEGCSGHNLAEAAVAGCAVLVGEHAGHFSTMADELNQAAVSGRMLVRVGGGCM